MGHAAVQTIHNADTVDIKITPNDRGNPPGKLADVKVHFSGNTPLVGLRLTDLEAFTEYEETVTAGV